MPLKSEFSHSQVSGSRQRLAIVAALTYSIVLELLAAAPDPTTSNTSTPGVRELGTALFSVPVTLRNLLHVPIYAFLGVLWFYAVSGTQRRRPALQATAIACTVGLLTEFSQLPMVTRVFSVGDLASNVLGASAGVLVASALTTHRLWRVGRSPGRCR